MNSESNVQAQVMPLATSVCCPPQVGALWAGDGDGAGVAMDGDGDCGGVAMDGDGDCGGDCGGGGGGGGVAADGAQ